MSATSYYINGVQMPVNPSSYSLSSSANNQTVNINNFGEINLIGKPKLRDVSWSSMFPAQQYSFAIPNMSTPDTYIKALNDIRANGKVVPLVISGTDISFDVTIESFDYGEDDGSGDVSYSISLKEYKTTDGRSSKATKSSTYTWKKGDTWQKVAKKKTGNSANASKLKTANKSLITKLSKNWRKKNPKKSKVPINTLLIGQKVVIKV